MKGEIIHNCEGVRVQTGEGECIKKKGKITGFLLSGLNAGYPLDADTFNANLYKIGSKSSDGYLYTSGALHITPINDVRLTATNGGDAITEDVGYNETSIVGYNVEYDVYRINGGVCLYKQLLSLDKKYVRLFEIDDEMDLFGTVYSNNGIDEFRGFKAQIGVREVKATSNTSSYIELTVYYGVDYRRENMNMHMIPLDSIPEGLIPIKLKDELGQGSAIVVESCSGNDITSAYGSSWTVDMFENKTGENPDTVTYSNTTKQLTITPAGEYRILNADALVDGDITGLEGINCYATITAITGG